MSLRDTMFAIFIAAVWGFNFIASKVALEVFSPMVANSLRFAIVLAVLFPFLRVVKGQMKLILWVAFLLGVMHFGLINLAVLLADGVGAISIAAQLGVPFSTILAVIVLNETVGWKRVVGIFLSFSGVIFLSFDPVIFTYWHALVVCTMAAFVYSICSILMRKMQDVSPLTTQAWVGLVACVGSVLISLAIDSGHVEQLTAARPENWLAILYTGLGSSVIGHVGGNYLFKKYEISVVSPYFLVMPLFAIIGGIVMLDEPISVRVFIGGALTIVGVLIVTLRNKTKHSAAVDSVKTEG